MYEYCTIMTEEQKQQIRNKIAELVQDTEKRIDDLKELTKPISPDNAIGRISRMDAINNKSVNEAGLRSAESKLKKLHRATEELDKNEYGLCTRCGNDIRFERLLFLPESTRCVNCAGR